MILYMKEPIPIMMKNLMLLDDVETGGLVFVSKVTYDQALLLWGRFEGDPNKLMQFTKSARDEWKDVPWILAAMKWVAHNAPEPLNMLAPTLKLLYKNTTIKEEDLNPEFIYGILHALSQAIDLNAVFLQPAEIRAQVSIPTSILLNYKASWDDILAPLKTNVVMAAFEDDDEEDERPVKKKKKAKKQEVVEEDDDEDEESDSDSDDDDDDFWGAIFAQASAEVEAKNAAAGVPTPAVVPLSTPTSYSSASDDNDSLLEDEREAEVQETNEVLNEFDME